MGCFYYDKKAYFHDKLKQSDLNSINCASKYGFKSKKCEPQVDDLSSFEADLFNMIKNIRYRNTQNHFQDKLRDYIHMITSSTKASIPADKKTNYAQLDKDLYKKLLADSITPSYRKAEDEIIHNINKETQYIATGLNIQDRTEHMAEKQVYISFKSHKDNFQQTCQPRKE